MPAISSADVEKVLAKLDAIYAGAEAKMRSHSYPIGSNQPDQNLGALNNTYNVGMTALMDLETDVVSGNYDGARWLDLAATTEKSMRDIDGYTEGVSVTNEIGYVTVQTIKDIPEAAPRIVGLSVRTILGNLIKGLGSATTAFLIVCVLAIIGVLYMVYMPHRKPVT